MAIFFVHILWPLPPHLNLPTVNYIIAAEFVDFLHIKSKSLKKKSAKVSPVHAKSSISFRRNYVVCLCAFPQKIEIQKKTLGKTKKIEKIIIAIVSASKTFCKKKERWSLSPGMIVVEARTTFFLRETINNDCGQCRIRDNTLNIFTILPLLNKFLCYLLVYSYQTG